jgi:hypothetical protein
VAFVPLSERPRTVLHCPAPIRPHGASLWAIGSFWTVPDPGCVKTSQAPKCVEWLFPNRSKSTAPRNRNAPIAIRRAICSINFPYGPFFYTAKTHSRPCACRPRRRTSGGTESPVERGWRHCGVAFLLACHATHGFADCMRAIWFCEEPAPRGKRNILRRIMSRG